MRRTILIVEDDLDLREALQVILESEGYQVSAARDGVDGLEKVNGSIPGIILLDMMMPRLDGFGFVRALEARGIYPGIPIIILTADGHARQKAEQLGAHGFLSKPFDVVELLRQITQLASP